MLQAELVFWWAAGNCSVGWWARWAGFWWRITGYNGVSQGSQARSKFGETGPVLEIAARLRSRDGRSGGTAEKRGPPWVLI